MSRVDENDDLLKTIEDALDGVGKLPGNGPSFNDSAKVVLLMDISKSLAVIADAMSCGEKNDSEM